MKRHTPKFIFTIFISFSLCLTAAGQNAMTKDFKPVVDSLDVLLKENRDVKGRLLLKNIMKRGNRLDFYFTESLGDYPWREGESEWFREQLESLFPDQYRKYTLGKVYSKNISLDRLETSELGSDGKPTSIRETVEKPSREAPLVSQLNGLEFSKGLSDRNIAVWHSHGRYFDYSSERWIWQRPCLFQTVEDMFTQSFVLPYLVPMLENAGAYVLLPRERDIQRYEVISDFDVLQHILQIPSLRRIL